MLSLQLSPFFPFPSCHPHPHPHLFTYNFLSPLLSSLYILGMVHACRAALPKTLDRFSRLFTQHQNHFFYFFIFFFQIQNFPYGNSPPPFPPHPPPPLLPRDAFSIKNPPSPISNLKILGGGGEREKSKKNWEKFFVINERKRKETKGNEMKRAWCGKSCGHARVEIMR